MLCTTLYNNEIIGQATVSVCISSQAENHPTQCKTPRLKALIFMRRWHTWTVGPSNMEWPQH